MVEPKAFQESEEKKAFSLENVLMGFAWEADDTLPSHMCA